MITQKDWKEYTSQINLYNKMQWDDTHRVNKGMRERHRKSEAIRKKRAYELAKITGTSPFYMPLINFGYCMPRLRTATIENCMTWICEGRPTIARKLTVNDNPS